MPGSRPQEIQQAEASVTDASAQLELAKRGLGTRPDAVQERGISTSQYDQARTKFDSATALLRRPEDSAAGEGRAAQGRNRGRARAGGPRASGGADGRGQPHRAAAQAGGTGRAQSAKSTRSRAGGHDRERRLNDTTIVAPIDGVVLVKSAEAGEVIAAGTTIVSIGDLDHPWLRAYINETDLGRVKLGQKVKLTTDSYPGKMYHGRGFLHRVGSRVHAQADPDQGGAREAGVPDQGRRRQCAARAEEQHAGGRGDPVVSSDHPCRESDARVWRGQTGL